MTKWIDVRASDKFSESIKERKKTKNVKKTNSQ